MEIGDLQSPTTMKILWDKHSEIIRYLHSDKGQHLLTNSTELVEKFFNNHNPNHPMVTYVSKEEWKDMRRSYREYHVLYKPTQAQRIGITYVWR